MSTPAVTVGGVSRRYGQVMAVDDVTLEVHLGDVYALGWPQRPRQAHADSHAARDGPRDRGDVEIAKQQVSDRAVWSHVGYLMETLSATPSSPGEP